MKYQKYRSTKFLIVVLLSAMLNAGCLFVRNPFRDRSEKPFNSAEWKKADSVDRGNMFIDLFQNQYRYVYRKTEAQVLEMLGEPDVKKEQNGKKVWGYNVDLGYGSDVKYFSVVFRNGSAEMFGM